MFTSFCFTLFATSLLSSLDTSEECSSMSGNGGRRVPAMKPQFMGKYPSVYVEKGTTVRLRCDVFNCESNWTMSWYMNGKRIATNRKRFHINTWGLPFLRIRNVQNKDAGVYKCVVANQYGRISQETNMTVLGKQPSRGQHVKGRFAVKQVILWPEGGDLKLLCAAKGGPSPQKYQWLKDGRVLKYRRLDPKLKTDRRYLKIKHALPSDTGLYTCIVSNRLGNISKGFQLKVKERNDPGPLLSAKFPVNKTARIGDKVRFQCLEVNSTTKSYTLWLHWRKLPPDYPYMNLNKMDIYSYSSYFTRIDRRFYTALNIRSEGKYGNCVLLTKVTKKDEGMYTCVIANSVGRSWRSAFLQVK